MRTPLSAICVTSVLLASIAQAQFLQLPQSQNGANLAYFVKATINKNGATGIVGAKNTGSNAASVAVLFTDGTGGFGSPITTAVSGVDNPPAGQLLVGDFNDDGNVDVAIFGKDHTTGASAVAVMLGNGDGTFQAGKETFLGATIGIPGDVCAEAAGDYTGDSKLDIAFINGGSLVVLPGNGNGTFSAPVTTSLSTIEF